MDEIKVTADIEATDQLGMLVRRIQVETPVKGDLRKQTAAVIEQITYLGSELKVIEVERVRGRADPQQKACGRRFRGSHSSPRELFVIRAKRQAAAHCEG